MSSETSAEPLGAVGLAADRDASGRFVPGNRAALIVGHRSAAFWAAEARARQEISDAAVKDAGYEPNDAPAGLRLAADGLAQATLIRDAAYMRVVAQGGPLTASGRVRRAFAVWKQADGAVKDALRLTGTTRQARPTTFADALLAARDAAQTDTGATDN